MGTRGACGFSLGHLEGVARIAGFIDKPGLLTSPEAEGFCLAN